MTGTALSPQTSHPSFPPAGSQSHIWCTKRKEKSSISLPSGALPVPPVKLLIPHANSLTKALAKELAPSNIQVNAIACGVIDTQMNACFSEEERAELADEIPAGRFGTPEETAHLAVQLATGNEYLTGQIITLDGGWL